MSEKLEAIRELQTAHQKPPRWYDSDEVTAIGAQLEAAGTTMTLVPEDLLGRPVPEKRYVFRIVLKNSVLAHPEYCGDTHVVSLEQLRIMAEVGAEAYVNAERTIGPCELRTRIIEAGKHKTEKNDGQEEVHTGP